MATTTATTADGASPSLAAATSTASTAVSTDATTTTATTTATTTTCTSTEATESPDDAAKPIHTLVLDTGPLIKNDPTVSTLLATAAHLVTTPAVVAEVRDPATRARVETTLLPFVALRTPRPASLAFVSEFARKTGDLEVLSRPDLQLLALTYEIECERNGGDWRLRSTPTQDGLNGKSPAAVAAAVAAAAEGEVAGTADGTAQEKTTEATAEESSETASARTDAATVQDEQDEKDEKDKTSAVNGLEAEVADLAIAEQAGKDEADVADVVADADADADAADDDGEGEWITPSNLKKVQQAERNGAPAQPLGGAGQPRLQAALLTSDFAMQNVALRINLNLLAPQAAGGGKGGKGGSDGLERITRVKTWVLRCHGCFAVTRRMDKQFCPRCGQATLTRTSCATDAATGACTLFLKRNYQHNKRGNVYSVPKPIHGSASGKLAAAAAAQGGRGGRGGWGHALILSEDQPEYAKKADEQRRAAARVRDMMDEDYLPALLTGVRGASQQRIRVGAGRNVNAKKRR